MAVGQPLPLPLALKKAAPIAITVTQVDKPARQFDLLVPMELATSVKEMAMPMIGMMMMGQQQPGAAPDEGEETEEEPPSGEMK